MSNYSQSAIIWPQHFLPGTTDNFVSNEIIVKGVDVGQIWTLLADTSKWESYYKNCAQVEGPSSGAVLSRGAVFKFSTFGFPQLTCTVEECVVASATQTGRLAWSSTTPEGFEIYHAWIVEGLEGQRVRVLTQESQNGEVFAEWAVAKPNKMLLGHQDWLDGLVSAARREKVGETNLETIEFPVRQLE